MVNLQQKHPMRLLWPKETVSMEEYRLGMLIVLLRLAARIVNPTYMRLPL
jgi:hypothetical protein